jgi:hypothetical protein
VGRVDVSRKYWKTDVPMKIMKIIAVVEAVSLRLSPRTRQVSCRVTIVRSMAPKEPTAAASVGENQPR